MESEFNFVGFVATEKGVLMFRDAENVLCEVEKNGVHENLYLKKELCLKSGWIGHNEWMGYWMSFIDAKRGVIDDQVCCI